MENKKILHSQNNSNIQSKNFEERDKIDSDFSAVLHILLTG